ncbi:hypothetical protein B0H17DRAFT_1139144 [Mycena rosella]|uniref:Uncharacterized protein n=1 Tax=Mycena rosella TaxID=1033263 RepID=A0AAD7D4Y5_MYCRO|nr:hypothetical protein B0H17DRAFT_1139144 [Mycena rosella]
MSCASGPLAAANTRYQIRRGTLLPALCHHDQYRARNDNSWLSVAPDSWIETAGSAASHPRTHRAVEPEEMPDAIFSEQYLLSNITGSASRMTGARMRQYVCGFGFRTGIGGHGGRMQPEIFPEPAPAPRSMRWRRCIQWVAKGVPKFEEARETHEVQDEGKLEGENGFG